jgi:hypothetical protein
MSLLCRTRLRRCLRKTSGIATWALLIIALCHGVKAQEAPLGGLTQQFSATVPTANGFTNPSQLTQQTGRQSCLIEFIGQTPTATGFVYFGPTAPAATTSAFSLVPKQFIPCGSGDGTIDTNAVWISSNATNDLFVFKVK